MNLDVSAVWIFLASLAVVLVIVAFTVGLVAWFMTIRASSAQDAKAEKRKRHKGKHIAHGV